MASTFPSRSPMDAAMIARAQEGKPSPNVRIPSPIDATLLMSGTGSG